MKEHSGSVDDMGKVKHPVEREGLYSSHQIHPANTVVDMRGILKKIIELIIKDT